MLVFLSCRDKSETDRNFFRLEKQVEQTSIELKQKFHYLRMVRNYRTFICDTMDNINPQHIIEMITVQSKFKNKQTLI